MLFPHAVHVAVRGAHAVTAIVEDPTSQKWPVSSWAGACGQPPLAAPFACTASNKSRVEDLRRIPASLCSCGDRLMLALRTLQFLIQSHEPARTSALLA
jgi:hypothetical protein